MRQELIHTCPELVDYINEIGFLPLLRMGIDGWSAEDAADEECQYTRLPDGGWEWPLGHGKGLCCVRAVAPMASSSSVKPRS